MKSFLLSFLLLILGQTVVEAQIKSPDEFLGYPLGSKFTSHEKVIAYVKYLGGRDKNVKIISYGKTYEGRELLVAVVSSTENIARLNDIKRNSYSLSKALEVNLSAAKQPAILWLSYNVHGNEASSSETAMKTLYELVDGKTKGVQEWLKRTVVVIDPCLNPDGRERYVNYFNEVSGVRPNANPMAREHFEPWPGGRSNHYYFDLNRDWAWQTQVETQQRLKLYLEWMPQVHVDFHEQNYNEPYYFAPAAEPIHVDVTAWQREFQVTVGKNNAKYFDENGWHYFTKERFDLLYPSYGDTYPLYNGSVGMTYEQGGIGAGLAVVTIDGDTLTLKDRIEHHYTTGMATLETVSKYSDKLVAEFKLYFENAATTPPGIYKTYIVKAQNLGRLRKLTALLKQNEIDFSFGADKNLRGYNYETKKTEAFKLERNDLVVNLLQPRAVLANVLFEPQTTVNDSNTYDITAWALPYAYGLKAYGVKEAVKGVYNSLEEPKEAIGGVVEKPYAWIFPWNSLDDVKILIALQKANVKVRVAQEPFISSGRSFPLGTLLVYRSENEKLFKGIQSKITAIQKSFGVSVYTAVSGYVEKGKDFGSSVYPILNAPKIAVVSGAGSSSQSVGEIWHFLEQELNYPFSMINIQNINNLDINKINTLIIPDGSYGDTINEKLEDWIKLGGKLILFEDAVSAVSGKKPFNVKLKEVIKDETVVNASRKYGERNQDDLSDAIPGAVFRVSLDQSHPLSAGLGTYYYTLKTDDKIYEPLPKDFNVGLLKSDSYVAGLAGNKVLKKLSGGMLFGVQSMGKGNVIYLGADILFRSFWENGKQMFSNAVFIVN
jgi:hypothetical protein